MHAALVGIFFQHFSVFMYQFHYRIIIVPFHGILCQCIKLVFWKSENFTYFTENRAVFKFYIGTAKGYVVFTVTVKNIFQNGITVLPAPVYIKIGRCFTVQVQEAFKIQIQFYRTYIGNTQTIGNDAVGTAAPANVHKTQTAAVTDNIPSNQEVTAELQFVYYF